MDDTAQRHNDVEFINTAEGGCSTVQQWEQQREWIVSGLNKYRASISEDIKNKNSNAAFTARREIQRQFSPGSKQVNVCIFRAACC